MSIRQYIFDRHVTKRAKKHLLKFVSYKDAKNILILANNQNNIEELNQIISTLKKDGKNVKVCYYAPDNNLTDEKSKDWILFGKKETNIFQLPTHAVISKINATQIDLLIDLTLTNVFPLMYLIHESNAFCKIGLKRHNTMGYSMLIDIEQTEEYNLVATKTQYLFEQIIFYLKKIQTTN